MFVKSRGEHASKHVLPKNLALLLCFASFCAGMFFSNRTWMVPDAKGIPWTSRTGGKQFVDYDRNIVVKNEGNSSGDISGSQHSILTMDKAISDLEIKLMASRAEHETIQKDPTMSEGVKNIESILKRKYFMVIGINTAFSSRKRRDSVRATWMPQAEKRKKLEEEKGIIIRFVIGHSSTSGGILDKAIEAEEKVHGDFLRLQHVEGYLELSAKTKTYFATAVSWWDAEFYVKVDDDIHVNLGMYCINMLMKMFLWELGLLVWMWSMWMIGDSAVVLHQIVNGKLKLVISVLLHLTGGAVGFAGLWRGLWRSMNVVVKTRMLYGAQTLCKR
ncbi:hypothetical protein E1A91_A05G182800v1 [Gossypium mustelinum]|uniref:Hexosyltransferase n=1 Tax=Gossypium mustelinum TaxID=34275 RepID=A0A5D2Z7W7_GOSMU|nr:hypothetical protein E1A91_A05G182800v1 [Gossypium mustelinum]